MGSNAQDASCIPYSRVAITGAKGQLGSELMARLGADAKGFDREDFDLTDPDQTRERLYDYEPDLVINTAAYTAVDKAESDEAACVAVNADAVANLAKVCEQLDCPLVQISTDYVFGVDTERSTPYKPSDEPGPVNVYGRSKLAGEQAAATWHKHLVVRTCGLYSVHPDGPQRGRNFCDTMLALAYQGTPLRVVDDQWCTPTFVPHLADMLLKLIGSNARGIHHATASGQTTWYRLANALFEAAGLKVPLTPITTAEYPTPARRPVYSVLSQEDVPRAQTWEEGCRAYAKRTAVL